MKIAIYSKTTGEILRHITTNVEIIIDQVGVDEEFYLNAPSYATHIINNEPVIITPDVPLDELKLQKLKTLKDIRDNKEGNGFEYLGKTFDSDPISIQRITLASMASQIAGISIDWTCKDGSVIKLSPQQFSGMLIAMVQRGDSIHKKWRLIKGALISAQTKEEVESINWSE